VGVKSRNVKKSRAPPEISVVESGLKARQRTLPSIFSDATHPFV
jgi:hypothetical protein